MWKFLVCILIFIVSPAPAQIWEACAQTILQAGPHTPGDVPVYVGAFGQSQAVLQDSGSPVVRTTVSIGFGGTLTGLSAYYICLSTCSVVLPKPISGAQFCVLNDAGVTTNITIAAISGVQFENTTFSGYGTQSTGTIISSGAFYGNKICLVGRDSSHYLVGTFTGLWTNS